MRCLGSRAVFAALALITWAGAACSPQAPPATVSATMPAPASSGQRAVEMPTPAATALPAYPPPGPGATPQIADVAALVTDYLNAHPGDLPGLRAELGAHGWSGFGRDYRRIAPDGAGFKIDMVSPGFEADLGAVRVAA